VLLYVFECHKSIWYKHTQFTSLYNYIILFDWHSLLTDRFQLLLFDFCLTDLFSQSLLHGRLVFPIGPAKKNICELKGSVKELIYFFFCPSLNRVLFPMLWKGSVRF